MAEGDRLGRLQVGEARHQRRRMGLGLGEQGPLQVRQGDHHPIAGGAHPQAQVQRHLVVARARGVQPSGRRPDQFAEPALDVHMDVLERALELEFARLDL